jgi:thiol-disulfide isomerase/thioredoxin
MPEKNRTVIVGVMFGLLLILALATYFFLNSSKDEINTETAGIFTNIEGEEPYTDLNGNPVTLDDYLGRILVVTTWASWSPFSQLDLEMLNSLAGEYNGEEVFFLAINRKESKEQAGRFLSTLPELNNIFIALDPRDHFYTAVGGYAMPEVVVYNVTGDVILHSRGQANREEIKQTIENNFNAE